jgi:hypothetical protein
MFVYIVWRKSKIVDTIQSVWDSEEEASKEVIQLQEERPLSGGFYSEKWKLNGKNDPII